MTAQLSLDTMFAEGARDYLPSDLETAVPFFRDLIERHHAAILAGHLDEAQLLNDEAHELAVKLNGGEPGILADDDAPGYVLERPQRPWAPCRCGGKRATSSYRRAAGGLAGAHRDGGYLRACPGRENVAAGCFCVPDRSVPPGDDKRPQKIL